jgi:hypothetical protein
MNKKVTTFMLSDAYGVYIPIYNSENSIKSTVKYLSTEQTVLIFGNYL